MSGSQSSSSDECTKLIADEHSSVDNILSRCMEKSSPVEVFKKIVLRHMSKDIANALQPVDAIEFLHKQLNVSRWDLTDRLIVRARTALFRIYLTYRNPMNEPVNGAPPIFEWYLVRVSKELSLHPLPFSVDLISKQVVPKKTVESKRGGGCPSDVHSPKPGFGMDVGEYPYSMVGGKRGFAFPDPERRRSLMEIVKKLPSDVSTTSLKVLAEHLPRLVERYSMEVLDFVGLVLHPKLVMGLQYRSRQYKLRLLMLRIEVRLGRSKPFVVPSSSVDEDMSNAHV
eukprot:CAMPEP_0201545662 /NCGR_PEP_ID=MMETSP0173_2-20130828/2108_1 /ASSEMBLY_ACC=CAM_ASM_000268 /TAXON_ID=218659 /ORGANISM="Vexillifera sp., Strain DIVA3 564/2" /LENGTH=283 /DNA_ID=CAMNT_0047954125 /DNA_START=118 /DNA_END=966 /DNA_ORIENTATION=+